MSSQAGCESNDFMVSPNLPPYAGDSESNDLSLPPLIATREIAPYGDILLELPSSVGMARMKVASQILCSASSVFRAMLGPTSSFKEAYEFRTRTANAEPYRLQLKDDNPEALGVVLLALHHQNELVPRNISFQNLSDLAIVCDKYDCATAVSLWVEGWTKDWKRVALEPGYEQWLFISWTFGMVEVFESLSKKLIMEGHYGTEDPTLFITREGVCLDDMLVPEPIMVAIREKRLAAIRAISEAAFYYQKRYMTPGGKPICKATDQSEVCDAAILGFIMKGFQSISLAPDPEKFLLKSVRDAEKSIMDLRIETITSPAYYCGNCFTYQLAANTRGSYTCICHHETTYPENGYGSRCEEDHFCQKQVTHQNTCNFLPELHAKVLATVAGIKLTWSDFKAPKEIPAGAVMGKWEIFEYK